MRDFIHTWPYTTQEKKTYQCLSLCVSEYSLTCPRRHSSSKWDHSQVRWVTCSFSVAVLRHHDQGTYRRIYWFTVSEDESMTITVRSMETHRLHDHHGGEHGGEQAPWPSRWGAWSWAGRHGAGAVVESLHLPPQAQHKAKGTQWECPGLLKPQSEPPVTASNKAAPIPTRTHLLLFPK